MVPPRFKYIIYSYLNPALTGQKGSGAKHLFIVFGFVSARRGLYLSSGALIMFSSLRII